MDSFKEILHIRYQGDQYKVYLNSDLEFYFLKLVGNQYYYPSEDEYKDLYSFFHSYPKYDYYFKNNLSVDPKIILKSGKIIALATFLSLQLGFSSSASSVSSEVSNPSYQEYFQYDTDTISGRGEKKVYYVNEYYDSLLQMPVTVCKSMKEFSNYVFEDRPTYEEVCATISHNPYIPEKFRDWLYEGISNLLSEMPTYDLSVLNYNLKNMVCQGVPYLGDGVVGNYSALTNYVLYVNNEDDEKLKPVILHEILGHASTIGAKIEDGKIVQYNQSLIYSLDQKEQYVFDSVLEGEAEIITQIAMGKKYEDYFASGYYSESEALRCFIKSIHDDSLQNMIENGGVRYLISKMNQNGIDYPLYFFQRLNIISDAKKQEDIEIMDSEMDLYEDLMTDYFLDYIESSNDIEESYSDIYTWLSDRGFHDLAKNVVLRLYDRYPNKFTPDEESIIKK